MAPVDFEIPPEPAPSFDVQLGDMGVELIPIGDKIFSGRSGVRVLAFVLPPKEARELAVKLLVAVSKANGEDLRVVKFNAPTVRAEAVLEDE